jgi:hypothetical protein
VTSRTGRNAPYAQAALSPSIERSLSKRCRIPVSNVFSSADSQKCLP